MKIDLLYEIQIPLPHGPTTEREYFWQALEQVEAADRAGFGCVWAVETCEELDQEDMVIIGDVDHVIEKLERYRDAGACCA